MSELTTTTEPGVSAWVLRTTPGSSRYTVRIGGGSASFGAIEAGHWVVVLDDGDIRRADDRTWGSEPFTLGLWVGNRVTPGTTEASHQAIEAIRNNDRNKAGIASPAQLTSCPWCGSEISGGRDIDVDRIAGRTLIHCGDKLGGCDFSKAKSSSQPYPGLPVKVDRCRVRRRPRHSEPVH